MSFCTLDTTTERQVVFLCPYDEEYIKDIAQRAARDEDGEVYYVPDDMTYQEWKKAFEYSGYHVPAVRHKETKRSM